MIITKILTRSKNSLFGPRTSALDAMIKQVREKPDEELFKRIAEYLMPLGEHYALKYSKKFPNYYDDFLGEASLAICRAVYNINNITHDNYVAYVTRYIQGALYLFVHKQVQQIKIDMTKNILVKKSSITQSDIYETISKANFNDVEHKIIMLYLMGETDSAIGKELNLTQQRIQQLRSTIFERIRKSFES